MSGNQNEFGCTLTIDTEEENPSIISEITGINYSECLVKDQKRTKNQEIITNEYNLWILKVERQEWPEGYLNSAIELILDILDKEKTKMVSLLKRFPKNHLLCFGYIYELNPYFIFDKKLIKRLNSYNIDIEFDLYCLND